MGQMGGGGLRAKPARALNSIIYPLHRYNKSQMADSPTDHDMLLRCILNNIWVLSDDNLHRCVFCAGEHPVHKPFCEIEQELFGTNDPAEATKLELARC